jgi:hypothetical protein
MSFDIVGDVHGHADALKALLRSLEMVTDDMAAAVV